MPQETDSDEFGPLEPDEVEALKEEQAEKRYMGRLTRNKGVNYSMLRKLCPIAGSGTDSLAAIELAGRSDDFFESCRRVAGLRDWTAVEGGQIKTRESSDPNDTHGYLVIRPEDDPAHDVIIRVWDRWPNSVVVMPRSDDPLPRQGKGKKKILEQMRLVGGKGLNDYLIWLERMRQVE